MSFSIILDRVGITDNLSLSMLSEKECILISLAKDGDQEAVSRLWQLNTPKLYGYLVNVLRDANLAEDILQNTWLKAVSALPLFRIQKVSFGAWLFAIARNECRQHWRAHNREVLVGNAFPEDISDNLSKAHSLDGKILLDSVVQKLSKDDQEILRLRYIADLPYKEIARLLGLSTTLARVRLHRALKHARLVIENK